MTRIEFAPGVTDDFDRIVDHPGSSPGQVLQQHDSLDAAARVGQIASAIDALGHNPLIGRPVAGRKRELVIGHDARGYVALYSYIGALDLVFVLAVRNQREAGYATNPPGN